MKTWGPIFLSIIVFGVLMISPRDADTTCADCRLPESTPRPTCTFTPEPTVPPNTRKYTAGSQGARETGSNGYYGWAPMVAGQPDLEVIPMVRDLDDFWQFMGQFTTTNTVITLGGSSQWIMGFNEPRIPFPAGSGMDSDKVVAGQALLEAFFPNNPLTSPSYSQDNIEQMRVDWIHFHEVYGRYPRWDALTFHCYFYDTPANCLPVVDWVIAFADEIEQTTGHRPEVWCTEFAAIARTGSAGPLWAQAALAGRTFIQYMEAVGVDRYFWFSYCSDWWLNTTCALVENGILTLLGEMYASF